MAGALFDLTGRVALVTGAGRGIGAEIARVLAGQGAAVAVNDLFAERAVEVASSIRASGPRACAVAGDVTDAGVCERIVREASAELGGIDVLVLNAGLPASGIRVGGFETSAPEEWRTLAALNVDAAMHLTRAVLPAMRARRFGRIVAIVSDAARSGEAQLAAYAAAKAALLAFARSLAREVADAGITVNAVALGSIASERRDADEMAKLARRYPTRRLGTPQDVAPAVLYLVSNEASWVTGQTLVVNGGFTTF
ncbi:MAG TPA: SDR family oxidoreductase [Myxococcota bacterium]|nr:SDR family oxidoreductase [Myxococcota bacterium]